MARFLPTPTDSYRLNTADQYKILAADIQGQAEFMVTNCKLTPEVDEQFHMVLGEVLDGVAEMESGATAESGVFEL